MEDDAIFWERLAEMPFEEHEQECVLRRERLVLQLAMLKRERVDANARADKRAAEEIGVGIDEVNAQLTLLNERIKYVRRLMDTISWKNIVKRHLGEDVYQELVAYRAAEEGRYLPIQQAELSRG